MGNKEITKTTINGNEIRFEFNENPYNDGKLFYFEYGFKHFFCTPGIIDTLKNEDKQMKYDTLLRILQLIQLKQNIKETLDYLQKVYINGITVWVIDSGNIDENDYITILLPEEY